MNIKLIKKIFVFILTNTPFVFLKPEILDNQLILKFIENKELNTENFHLQISDTSQKLLDCQSLAYLSKVSINKFINCCKTKIDEIGRDKIEIIINKALFKEIELKDSHYVFYHGQKRDFLLYQDLCDKLYKKIYQKENLEFTFTRIKDKNFINYKDIDEFLSRNPKIKDGSTHIRKLLLSVNPSFFGNSSNISHLGSSTFLYFIESSSCYSTDIKDFLNDLFDFFNLKTLYLKYQNNINELIYLLQNNEFDKTGILLQIFIPKNLVDKITYKSEIKGKPSLNKIPSKAIEEYKNNKFLKDKIQFRILINEDFMLNPDSGIKFFRYYNKTEYIKKYEESFEKLMQKIEFDLDNN